MFINIEVEVVVGAGYPAQDAIVMIGESEILELAKNKAEAFYKDKIGLRGIASVHFEP